MFYFGSPGGGNHSPAGKQLAELISAELIRRTDRKDCRTHPRTWDLLRLTTMPAVRVDLGYMSNVDDSKRLNSEAFHNAIAQGIAAAITAFVPPVGHNSRIKKPRPIPRAMSPPARRKGFTREGYLFSGHKGYYSCTMSEQMGSRLDPWVESYAQRAQGLTASAIRALFAVASRPEVVSLAGGMPYVNALDADQFADITARVIREQGNTALQYGSGQGDQKLREQILEITSLVGVHSHPDDIVVTAGSQMGLDLVTKIFCDPGDTVLVESPSYVGALGVFRSYQCNVVHVDMDEHGLNPEALRSALAAHNNVKFIYTIPSFHNPAGLTQSQQRREEILAIAQEFKVPILEDDPYGLLGFEGEPPQAIRALDDQNVIYLGSFSKTIASGLRLGWVIAPHGVRENSVGRRGCDPMSEQFCATHYFPLLGRTTLAATDQNVPGVVSRTARFPARFNASTHA